MDLLTYLFWPNPGNTSYDNPKVMALIAAGAGFVVLGLLVKLWRRKMTNTVTKKLTRSWAGAAFWFGAIALLLVVSRAEQIQFLSMRILWFVWALALLLYGIFQWKNFRMRHYQVLPRETSYDPREKYLPGKGKR
ncbi:MAG: hypothetical protein Q7R81_04210 [Candidatus Peregrinibacteria bacterium]|nr:hypothetical protein [Candidatus Peregrinibacteria bacterium]